MSRFRLPVGQGILNLAPNTPSPAFGNGNDNGLGLGLGWGISNSEFRIPN